jgi:hypothetical protein
VEEAVGVVMVGQLGLCPRQSLQRQREQQRAQPDRFCGQPLVFIYAPSPLSEAALSWHLPRQWQREQQRVFSAVGVCCVERSAVVLQVCC